MSVRERRPYYTGVLGPFRTVVARLAFVVTVIAFFWLEDTRGTGSQANTNLRKLPSPTEVPREGYVSAWCAPVSSEVKVCVVMKAAPGPKYLELVVRDALVQSWERWTQPYWDEFDLFLGDLDGDRSDELIVVDRLGTSNGMPIPTDQVTIVSDYASERRKFVSFWVRDYAGGTFVTRPGRSGTWIFATEWMWDLNLDPRRDSGNYLVGRWFRYNRGRLVPQPGVLVRRLLLSFYDERAQGADGAPYVWFANGKGRVVTPDPALGNGREVRSRRGTLVRVDDGDATRDPVYALRLDGAVDLEVTFEYSSPASPSRQRIDRIRVSGVDGRRYVLPMGVAPTSVIGDVVNKSVRLVTYRDGDRERQVMWIE